MTSPRPHLLSAAVVGLCASLCTSLALAQTPDLAENFNNLRQSAVPVTQLVLAAANMKVGVSLDRLTLISGEGNTDKKITAGLLAGAATLLGSRTGTGFAKGIDFAEREPIHEHLDKEQAEKINAEAVALMVAKLKAAGVDVVGPEAVVAAPFYASVRGEAAVTTDHLAKDGGLFKKSYFYGFYRTPVAGMKYRDKPGLAGVFSDDDWFTQARKLAQAQASVEFNVALVNDKKVFGLFEMSMRVIGNMTGRDTDSVLYLQTLKNPDDFQVPSGGKDAYAYWQAFKPQFESVAAAMAERTAKAVQGSQKQ